MVSIYNYIDCCDPMSLAKMFWTMSHGIISLYHSRVLQEVEQDAEGAYLALLDRFINCLGRKEFVDAGFYKC